MVGKQQVNIENCVAALARANGLLVGTVHARLLRGWTRDEALGLVKRKPRRRSCRNKFGPEIENYMRQNGLANLAELAEQLGVSHGALRDRLSKGMSLIAALNGPYAVRVLGVTFPTKRRATEHFSIPYSTVNTSAKKHGTDFATELEVMVRRRRGKRRWQGRRANKPLPPAVLWGWRFRSWSSAHAYWSPAAGLPALSIVLEKLRDGQQPEWVFHAARALYFERGQLTPEGRRADEAIHVLSRYHPIGERQAGYVDLWRLGEIEQEAEAARRRTPLHGRPDLAAAE